MKKLNKKDIKIKVIPILKKYRVKKAALFGSYATGEATAKSDVDILVEMAADKSLLDLVALEDEIKNKLKKNVDVITYNSIYHRLRDRILSEQQVFYG